MPHKDTKHTVENQRSGEKKKSVAKRSKTMTFKNHLNNCLRVLNKKLLTSCVLQRQQNLKIDKYTNER